MKTCCNMSAMTHPTYFFWLAVIFSWWCNTNSDWKLFLEQGISQPGIFWNVWLIQMPSSDLLLFLEQGNSQPGIFRKLWHIQLAHSDWLLFLEHFKLLPLSSFSLAAIFRTMIHPHAQSWLAAILSSSHNVYSDWSKRLRFLTCQNLMI